MSEFKIGRIVYINQFQKGSREVTAIKAKIVEEATVHVVRRIYPGYNFGRGRYKGGDDVYRLQIKVAGYVIKDVDGPWVHHSQLFFDRESCIRGQLTNAKRKSFAPQASL